MVYLILLAIHVTALTFLGGMVILTDLRLLGVGMRSYSAAELMNGLRTPKRIGLALAAISGLLMFGAHAQQFSHNFWFWAKIGFLLLIGANWLLLKRGIVENSARAKIAGSLSLLLWTGVICAGRGPATIKDVMHSMIDPNGDFVFQAVTESADEHGAHENAPKTDAEWEDLRQHLAVLAEAPGLLEGRKAARVRDRSRNPQVESEPEQIQAVLDSDPASLARRARKLQDAAKQAMQAVDARNTAALLKSIDSIDKACEGCHLHYWYPNDKRAREAAKEDGITDF